MNLELIEGAIYKLKVSLHAEKYSEVTHFSINDLGENGLVLSDSHVFYDQEKNGWHIFGCFEPSIGYYVRIPDYIVREQVELVDKDNLVPLKKN